MEKTISKQMNQNYKDFVDCYYLLLRKFKKKSSYVLDEFLIKENKESDGSLSIYEDVNIDAFYFFILSMIDSEYNIIKTVNILNVQDANVIVKALCFYMDNVKIEKLLKKNTKNTKTTKIKLANNEKDAKSLMTKKENSYEKKKEEIQTRNGIEYNKSMCNIKSITVFNSNLNTNGILFLAKSLYNNEYFKLEHLSINCNVLTSECIRYLSLSLCNYNNLKSLSLQYCGLKDDSIVYITDIIIYINSSLAVLNLCGNQFTEAGMAKLFESFLLNKSLTNVDVSYNMFTLEDTFVDVLVKIIESTMNITTILLAGNFIEKINLQKINEAMNSNKSIAILKLPQDIDDEIVKEINKKLKKKKKIKKKEKQNFPRK